MCDSAAKQNAFCLPVNPYRFNTEQDSFRLRVVR